MQAIPERRLLGAILQRAFVDAISSTASPDRREARGWLISDSTHPFSFLWICLILDLDPARIRRNVILWSRTNRRRSMDFRATMYQTTAVQAFLCEPYIEEFPLCYPQQNRG